MGRIVQLDESTISKIAAGEVIESPASVVRELLDNAIDAQAKWISIHISEGGRSYIEVSDDGIGMDKEDLLMCVKKHATSKIKSFDDVFKLNTLGFRGEALSSIAEISKLKITSRAGTESSISTAYTLVVEGGKVLKLFEASRGRGTTVVVEDLFFNIPARRKFLSGSASLRKQVEREIIKKSLSFYNIGFEYYSEGRKRFVNPIRTSYLERINDFFPDVINDLLYIEKVESDISITGYISRPNFIRPNRIYEYFFVNNRPVEWKNFYFILQNVYEKIIPKGYFPAAFIYINIDPEEIDVNVHPSKREIKFKNEAYITKMIMDSIDEVLNFGNAYNLSERVEFTPYEKRISEAISEFFSQRGKEDSKVNSSFGLHNSQLRGEGKHYYQSTLFQEVKKFNLSSARFVGIIFNTYIILETEDKIIFVDQHAAHERINYEKFKTAYNQKILTSYELLIPIEIEVPAIILEEFVSNIELLKAFGFEIEPFGGNSFLVRGAPVFVDYGSVQDVIFGFIEGLKEKNDTFKDEEDASLISPSLENAMKQMACKSSVKGGKNLSKQEVEALLKELDSTSNNMTCPHGRPIAYIINRDEVARWFRRT